MSRGGLWEALWRSRESHSQSLGVSSPRIRAPLGNLGSFGTLGTLGSLPIDWSAYTQQVLAKARADAGSQCQEDKTVSPQLEKGRLIEGELEKHD